MIDDFNRRQLLLTDAARQAGRRFLGDIGIQRRDIPAVVGDGLPPMEVPVSRGRGPLTGFRLRPGTSRAALR